MPSYQEVIDADPSALADGGEEFASAARDLAAVREQYRSHVDGLGDGWEGEDHRLVREEAGGIEEELADVERDLEAHSDLLATLGGVAAEAIRELQDADRSITELGYAIDRTGPSVTVGPELRSRADLPTAPKGLGAFLESAAAMATHALQLLHRATCVMDQVLADALDTGEPPSSVSAVLADLRDVTGAASAIVGLIGRDGADPAAADAADGSLPASVSAPPFEGGDGTGATPDGSADGSGETATATLAMLGAEGWARATEYAGHWFGRNRD